MRFSNCISLGILLFPCGCSSIVAVSAYFVHRPAFCPLLSPSKRGSCRGGMTMYFDDVSRGEYTLRWNSKGNKLKRPGLQKQTYDIELNRKRSAQKLDAIKKLLLGYDALSASELSDEQILQQVELWTEKSGVVGDFFGNELYESLLGLSVCRSTSLVGCMAQFWKSVVDVIHEYSDEYNPVDRWTINVTKGNQVFLIGFPDCEPLYDYNTMSTLSAAVEFSKYLCLHLGKRFTLSLFHPNYKDSPTLMSPARHSPFPASGLHFSGKEDAETERMLERTKPRTGYVTSSRNAAPIDESNPILKQRRIHLEIMFNSAAASSTADNLNRDPSSRNLSQRFPNDLIIDMVQVWADMNRFTAPQGKEVNRALQFADTITRWVVTDSKIGEEAYYDIWSAISDLYDEGVAADKPLVIEKEPTEEEGPSINVISSMFVATKFCAFNAQGFKRFAITVNAALKRLTDGKMFIEVFHPEYVGNKGYNNKLRRAPYPVIQICYEIKRSKCRKQLGH